jgi:type IV pilus assembly protein PilB
MAVLRRGEPVRRQRPERVVTGGDHEGEDEHGRVAVDEVEELESYAEDLAEGGPGLSAVADPMDEELEDHPMTSALAASYEASAKSPPLDSPDAVVVPVPATWEEQDQVEVPSWDDAEEAGEGTSAWEAMAPPAAGPPLSIAPPPAPTEATEGDDRQVPALGALLVAGGMITREQLAAALREQERTGKKLGRILIDLGLMREADIVRMLARQVGLEFVDLADYPVDPSAAALIPEATARRYLAIGIGHEDGKLVLAMSDPSNVFALDDIRTITGVDLKPVVAAASDVEAAIRRYSRMDAAVEEFASEAAEAAADADAEIGVGAAALEEGPIVKLVNLLISQAVNDRASDIHVEPTERDVRIRYRIDGVLHEVMRSPKNIQSGLSSRLKIMADINIAERRIPQDGRVSVTVSGKQIDLRVATLPTVYGEKVVLRILDKSQALIRLEDLGFGKQSFDRYEDSFLKPYGAILVCGPTGSGKSTTLYATLNIINSVDRNIITVEDPVEYRIPGINQVQIHMKAGLTFASALRSILRSDPDTILIGEIRDKETAMIAVESALTGHLVLSSLHTNDAASAVTRLVEMGVEPYLVSSALDCVVAQRLARKLCDKCKEAYKPSEVELQEARFPEEEWEKIAELYRAVGCGVCGKTGFRGRLGLYEVMPVTEEVERLCVARASSEDIKRLAVEQGMLTLRDDGFDKARQGLTTIEEVFRVVA